MCAGFFFSPSSLIFSSELENLVKTNHSTWPMAFILSTEHFHKSKLPFNIWHSKSKHYLTQGGEFVTQISRWNWRAGQGKTWALSIVYASTAGCLHAERWRRNITGLMQRAWKIQNPVKNYVFHIFRKRLVHNFTFELTLFFLGAI